MFKTLSLPKQNAFMSKSILPKGFQGKLSKAMKGIGIIQKLSKTLPRHFLIARYKSTGDLSLTMVLLIMFNKIMKVSIKKMKGFNIMLLLQLQVPSKEHLRVNYTAN